MGQIETYLVTETPLGWNAPGLFRWEKAQKELLESEKTCSVTMEDQVWIVREMDGLGECIKGFIFESPQKERARAFFPLSVPAICLVVKNDEISRITSEGAYMQVFTEDGSELVRVKEAWKASDRESGIRHRIEVFSEGLGLQAAIAYALLSGILSPPKDHPAMNSITGSLIWFGLP